MPKSQTSKGGAGVGTFRHTRKPSVAVTSKDVAVPKSDRRIRRSETKRSTILDAGLSLFSRLGLHGTAVDQIAELADVSKANLFYYFSTKEEIYASVLLRLLDSWLAPLRMISIDSDPAEAIGRYIRLKIAFSRQHPEASRLFCLEMIQGAPIMGEEIRTTLKALVDSKASIFNAWAAAGKIAPVDPYHLIFAIWSMTQHYADFRFQVEALVGKTLDDETYYEETILNVQNIIMNGLQLREKPFIEEILEV